MSARPRRRRISYFEAIQSQAHDVAVERARRGSRRFHLVLHRPLREWAFVATGQWPERGRPLYRWRVHLGPLELRRWAS